MATIVVTKVAKTDSTLTESLASHSHNNNTLGLNQAPSTSNAQHPNSSNSKSVFTFVKTLDDTTPETRRPGPGIPSTSKSACGNASLLNLAAELKTSSNIVNSQLLSEFSSSLSLSSSSSAFSSKSESHSHTHQSRKVDENGIPLVQPMKKKLSASTTAKPDLQSRWKEMHHHTNVHLKLFNYNVLKNIHVFGRGSRIYGIVLSNLHFLQAKSRAIESSLKIVSRTSLPMLKSR
jgi:hypothetical protein